jgi:hypothetical protein
MQPPLVGEGGVDDTLGEGLGVVLPAELPPPPAHPTAKASTAAPPNSAIAVLAPDFIQRSILMSGRFVPTRVCFHCRIVALLLSSVPVTLQLPHRCQRAQCASNERHLLVARWLPWAKRNVTRVRRPRCRGHRPASAAGPARRTACDVFGSRRAGARTYDPGGTHLAEKNARLREMVKSCN